MLKPQYFGHLMWKNDSGKVLDAGKDCGQEEKGMTEDKMVGWHHWLNGHEFAQTHRDGEGHGSLASCSPKDSQESYPMPQFKSISSLALNLFMVQLSHLYLTTGKTMVLTRQTFVGKVMSLLFNMSRFVIAFLPRSKRLLISWLQSPSAVMLEPKKTKPVTVSIVFPSICHEVMGPEAMIFVFWMLNFSRIMSKWNYHGNLLCQIHFPMISKSEYCVLSLKTLI